MTEKLFYSKRIIKEVCQQIDINVSIDKISLSHKITLVLRSSLIELRFYVLSTRPVFTNHSLEHSFFFPRNFLYLEEFECYTTSDRLKRPV